MKKTFTILLMIFPWCLGIKAQNLVLMLNNSTTETYPIVNIQSIKFGTSSMILNEFDGTVTTWNIQDINQYFFNDLANVEFLSEVDKSNLTIFPNPSIGAVNVQFTSKKPSFVIVDIIDASGKQIQTIFRGEHNGKETYEWNGNVPNGVYYCRIRTDDKTITKPIIIK